MRHIIPISGKDSLATALVQTAYEPNHNYEYFVNIVSKELPPFYDWLALAENHLKVSIYRMGEDLGKVTEQQGILPNSKTRFCTRLAKIKPMEKWIGDNETIIYYGLRADEQMRVGYQQSKENITAKYPLREHGITLPAVWAILEAKNLLPPAFIFNEVVEGAKAQMGDDFTITEKLLPWHYNKLFSWRTRPFNCYDCFFMRQYEFIGLSIYYPEEFEKACIIEETTGADNYTLREGYTLRELAKRKDEVIEKRISRVVSVLYQLAQKNIFEELPDELETISCGLLCGK